MPMSGSNYVAPTWVDNAPPALDAAELQAMCNTIQENQSDATALQAALQALTTTVSGKSPAKIVSYVGTGTYGASNPCSITADFPIKFAKFLGWVQNNLGYFIPIESMQGSIGEQFTILPDTLSSNFKSYQGFCSYDNFDSYSKYVPNTIYWYHLMGANQQFNLSGNTYYVLCVG